ncbi:MAG: purine-nucleoside phosphorylase [Planctomycetaceae bacterium]|jgi:purine-nucleoside phosphorylase|nr:purine-nucleoside phosphorylase [Planctomycetaceae bacterium]
MPTSLFDQIQEAANHIRKQISGIPTAGMILGTGLGGLATQIQNAIQIPYGEIPHFPESTVESHAGQLVFGELNGTPILAMEGRFHYYEGYSLEQVTFPVRVMKELGAEFLFVTSAVGGMNPQYELSDIVIIEDHINMMPDNPLRGSNDDRLGPRFPDMCQPYDKEIIGLAKIKSLELGIAAHTGVLVAVPGPNLETRAEYRLLRNMGADIVGMSTVPEIIVAAHCGLRAVAFSVVTDICLPDALEPVEIAKIIEVAGIGGEKLTKVLPELIGNL